MKKHITKNHILLLAVLFFINVISILVLFFPNVTTLNVSTNTHEIILTDEGFSPSKLTVKKNDIVIFRTTRAYEFWPASDLHPSHDIYPAFDPQQPIPSDETWKFTFEKTGTWGFHDHLAPLFRGTVTVTDSVTKTSEEFDTAEVKKCNNSSNKQKCWHDTLLTAIEKIGLENAYQNYAYLFVHEPTFAENCHEFTHLIGEAAYEEFKKNKDFPVTEQVSYCSYGFFHGFIEAMMLEQHNLEQAREFCDIVDHKLRAKTATLGACLHGIGHGVTDGSDPRAHGNPFLITGPGLSLCEKIGQNEYEVKLCATGVFNALAIMYTNSQQGLKPDKEDPLWICREQTRPSFKHACFDDFKAYLLSLTGGDMVKAAHYLENEEEIVYAYAAMDNLATFYVYYLLDDPTGETTGITLCRSLQKRLQLGCIQGIGAGFMTAGIPDQEYFRALRVCQSTLLNEHERDGCYQRVLPLVALRYPTDKTRDICATVQKKYQIYCTRNS